LALSPEILLKVQAVFDRYGVPRYIWQSIAHMETGGTFDPSLKNVNMPGKPGYNPAKPAEASYGLFQLNTNGGQGLPWADRPDELLDPVKNAEIAAPEIARAYQVGVQKGFKDGPDLAAWVAANSGHPGYGLSLDQPAVAIVRSVAPTYIGTAPSSSGGSGNGGTFGTGPDGRPLTFQEWLNQIIQAPSLGDAGLGYLFGYKNGQPRGWSQFWADAWDDAKQQGDDWAKKGEKIREGITGGTGGPTWLIFVAVGAVALVLLMGGTFGLVAGKEA
jgi:hypothetical protein